MYYILICREPEKILSIHTCLEEALQEKDRLDYEIQIKRTLASYQNHYFDTFEYDIVSVSEFKSSGLTLEQEKEKLDKKYQYLLEEAQEKKKQRDTERELKEMIEQQKKRDLELSQINEFMSWWDFHQPMFYAFMEEKEIKTAFILPIVRSYLLHKNDSTIREWMLKRYIL